MKLPKKSKSIYVLSSPISPYLKIGMSNNTKVRCKTISNGSGVSLEIVFQTGMLQNADYIERKVKEHFADKNKFGEWFDITKKEAKEYIRSIESEYDQVSDIILPHTEIEIKNITEVFNMPEIDEVIYNNKIGVQSFKNSLLGEYSFYFIKYTFAGFNIYLKFIYEGEAKRYVDKLKDFIQDIAESTVINNQ